MNTYDEMIQKANSGDTIAQINLAQAYFSGEVSGTAEIGKGLCYMEMAAESGNPVIQRMYANLLKIAGMDNESFKWLEKAALQDDAESQGMLAKYYFSGFGVAKNDSKALQWALKARKNGDSNESCVVLGILHLQGKVVTTDAVEAYKMFCVAAKSGNDQATEFKENMELQFPQLKNIRF